MERCGILFILSFVLMLIAELLKRFFAHTPEDRIYRTDNWADSLSGILFVIAGVMFFVTLFFSMYIYMFQ